MRDVIRSMADVIQQAKLTNAQQIALKAHMDKGEFDKAYQELEKMLAGIPKEVTIGIKPGGTPTAPAPEQSPVPAGPQPGDTIFVESPGGKTIRVRIPVLNQTSANSTGQNVIVNVAGSIVTQSDLVEEIRLGLIDAQKSGKQLVYSNT